MNRLTRKIAAVALAVLVLGGISAQARDKKPKHKKHEDLSANPLAGVKSKQPDKELFDKAMIAMKKSRFDVARLDLQTMLNTYPDSEYRMRAKQKLRDVQEVLAERETQIGLFYGTLENFAASIARLQTVVDTYPLYSKSDQALLGIGDAFAGQAHAIQIAPKLPGAIKERLRAIYQDKAAAAYAKVITRYPMAPHVEDARDRLVAMNRPVPEPTPEAIAENDAEERSRQPLRFTGKTFDIIKHGPTVVEAVHVGEPSLDDPKRTLAPDLNRQNLALFNAATNAGKPAAAVLVAPTGVNEPPRSDQPSQAPLQLEKPAGGTGVGVEIVNAPPAAASPVIKPVGPVNTTLPAAEKPVEAPDQVNDVKSTPAASANASDAKKKKADLGDESSSKKKKKKGLSKLKPF